MWRRYGDAVYALLVLGGLALQAGGLGFLGWSFLASRTNVFPGPGPELALLLAVALAAAVLVALVGFVLAYHAVSAQREERRRESVAAWTDRWVGVAFGGEPPAAGPLPREAVEALLNVRETLQGREAAGLERLLGDRAVGDRLLPGLRSRHLGPRLEALEALARSRLAAGFYPALPRLHDREPHVRTMAARALACTLSRMPDGPGRDRAEAAFASALARAALPSGVVLEALVLLEGAAHGVLRRLLAAGAGDGGDTGTLRGALEAAGRLQLLSVAEAVAGFARHPDPEARAAAIRALGRLGYLPEAAAAALLAATFDDVEFVRVQAARAAVLLPREASLARLYAMLGDPSWWVRQAAAGALLEVRGEGQRTLERAARSHPDRYARHMAVQTLLDAELIDPDLARRLREAA